MCKVNMTWFLEESLCGDTFTNGHLLQLTMSVRGRS